MNTEASNLATLKMQPYVFVYLCDFCPGYTVVEEDPQFCSSTDEGYAMQVTDSDGREWGFCPDCLRDTLLGMRLPLILHRPQRTREEK